MARIIAAAAIVRHRLLRRAEAGDRLPSTPRSVALIVDVHTHIPTHADAVPADQALSDPLVGKGASLTGSLPAYIEAMSTVERAIVFGIAPRPGLGPPVMDWRAGWPDDLNQNDIAARVAATDPDRFIPFMSLHPEQPDLDDEYDRSVGDLGCRGIKVALSYQVVDPASEAAYRLFARLEEDGLPVVFHQGASIASDARLDYAHPLAMDRVAIAFPKLKIVLAHVAHPWFEDCVTVVRKHPNVCTDVSGLPLRPWLFWRAMRVFHEYGVTHKMLLGSDWPLWTPQQTIDGLRGLARFANDHHLPGIPESEIEGIINRDSLDLLGLS